MQNPRQFSHDLKDAARAAEAQAKWKQSFRDCPRDAGNTESKGADVARLAITKEFLDQYGKLEKSVQKATWSAISKFEQHTHAGLHLEKISNSRDPRMRTIRVDIHWRGVILAPESGDTYGLLAVMPHDKAIEYAANYRSSVNPVLGIFEISNDVAIEQMEPLLAQSAAASGAPLFERISDSDLLRLGISPAFLPLVRLLGSEALLEAMQPMLPEAQYTALYALACGMTVEDAWQEVAQYLPAEPSREPVDTSDLVSAMERSTDRIVIVSDENELRAILDRPFAAWRTFLHPAQRKLAYAPQFAGPAQVTGSAGTGKTITALHRAAFLAGQADTPAPGHPSVLLTTYTNNLADALAGQFDELVEDEGVRHRVEIGTVDRLAYHIVERARGTRPAIAPAKEIRQLWITAVAEVNATFPVSFLEREWEQVILAQDLHTEPRYLTCLRTGQGRALSKAQRSLVWQLTERVTAELRARNEATFLQLANEAARILRETGDPLFRHAIVDEAQDLHPAQWRLIRAATAAGANDLFLVGDPHQRIYHSRVSLTQLGIQVRGRSRRLNVNYRTTQEILAWSVPLLGEQPVAGLDDQVDSLVGYWSPMHGRRPEVRACSTWDQELAALTAKVQGWLDEGIEPYAIGVAARTSYLGKQAGVLLAERGIPSVSPRSRASKNAIRLGTMHGMKGLEFQAVAAIGVNEENVPYRHLLADDADDPVAQALDLQRERCLLFVACTRARDHLYVSYNGTPSPFLP
jgi:superfamily I DNA/RNA helicase